LIDIDEDSEEEEEEQSDEEEETEYFVLEVIVAKGEKKVRNIAVKY
jgi:hypothetical protein